MARVIGIDFGEKRTGLAVTDDLQIIASGLTTVQTSELIPFLTSYVQQEEVILFVIGKPVQMNNTESQSEPLIKQFINKLQAKFPKIGIKRVDERFTSKLAVQSMVASKLKKKYRQNKALVDEISATIILQTYLDGIKFEKGNY